MRDRALQIGLFGTFDLENYGDLLFPLVAEAELTERLGRVKVHRFSYNAKSTPDWPYVVTSLTELPRIAGDLDGVLIGGGFIIRFDKDVAPGYGPPTPAIHHPTGYWLTPALVALQRGIPLIWNAPGMHCNEIPTWAEPLMQVVFANSGYIVVRDEPSQEALARFVDHGEASVMPDTGFGISRLLDQREPSAEFNRLRETTSGLTGPYIVVQAIRGLDGFVNFVKKHRRLLRDFRFLELPIGPVLDDHEGVLGRDLPGLIRLHGWPHPLLLGELISHSAAVVGHSYHLAITALACGVPVFSSADLSVGKYTALSRFETIYSLPDAAKTDPAWFRTRVGKTTPTPAARAAAEQLAQHWDRVSAVLQNGSTGTQRAVSQFLQSLPGLLEAAPTRGEVAPEASARRIAELSRLLDGARAEIRARDDRIATLLKSPSWKVTAPARFVTRNLKRLVRK